MTFFEPKKNQHGKPLLVALNNLSLKYLPFLPRLSPAVFPPSNSNDTVCSDCLFVLAWGQQPLLGDCSWPLLHFNVISPLQQRSTRAHNGWNMVSKKSNKDRARGSARAMCEQQQSGVSKQNASSVTGDVLKPRASWTNSSFISTVQSRNPASGQEWVIMPQADCHFLIFNSESHYNITEFPWFNQLDVYKWLSSNLATYQYTFL